MPGDTFINSMAILQNMALSQKKSRRKPTGGRYVLTHSKKERELGNPPTLTRMEKTRKIVLRVLGGIKKERLLATDSINVYNPMEKKHSVVKITSVVENKANQNYVRRHYLTQGAVVTTEMGKVRITSRPGQSGAVNGVLL